MSHSPLIRRAAASAAAVLAASAGAAVVGVAPAAAEPARRAVYTLSNASAANGGNAVLAYRDTDQGALTPIGTFPTGGNGNNGGLGSQGAVVLSDNDHQLAAVNAVSNTVSLFDVRKNGSLRLRDTVDTAGVSPISATIDHNRLFVLNAGGGGNAASIVGFKIEGHRLRALSQGARPLSPGAAGPAEVAFTPNGKHLVVTEKASNSIDTFAVAGNGKVGPPVSRPSTGTTPFGFAFDRNGHAIVSFAAGGAPGASGVSSYSVSSNGTQLINSVPDTQTAACWIAMSVDGRHAYTTNAGAGTVSSYDIADDGTLTLANAIGTTVAGHPTDEAVGGSTLYVLETDGHRIAAADIGANGALGAASDVVTGLPASAVGLAATEG